MASETDRLRAGLVLLHSAVLKWLPATADNHLAVPERAAWEVREKSHTVMPGQTGRGLSLFQPGMDREGVGRERMGNKFVFFLISFSMGHCGHLPESSAPSAGWTQSTDSVGLRLN